MSVSGLCEICEQREVEDGCDRCGRLVCDVHYKAGRGVCTECFAEMGGPSGGGREREEQDRPDGVDEYQF